MSADPRTKSETEKPPTLLEHVNIQGTMDCPARDGVVRGEVGDEGAVLETSDGQKVPGRVSVVSYHEPGRGSGWRMEFKSKDGNLRVTIHEMPNTGVFTAQRLAARHQS